MTTRCRMTHGLSKSKLMAFRQCPKRLWLDVHRPDLLPADLDHAPQIVNGNEVGAVARTLHPGGALIEADDLDGALALTAETLAGKTKTLFEATFRHEGVLVRADVLKRSLRRLHLIEVKAASSVKDYYHDDVAVQAWVLSSAGHAPDKVSVAHVDTSFEYAGDDDYDGLLAAVDVGVEADARQPDVPKWVAAARRTLDRAEPDIDMGPHCQDPYDCPFTEYCTARRPQPRYPVTALPYGGKLVEALGAEGYADLRKVPKARLSSPQHLRVWEATKTGRPYISSKVADIIRELLFPRYFLDFETVAPAVPRWAGTRPYQAQPFQFSCHIEKKDGSLEHREFLDLTGVAPMRGCAEALLAAVGKRGPVLTYSHFERSVISGLAARFPDLADALTDVAARIVDLLPIAREHYYHRDQLGSWSIKAVLPTIAPDLAYDNLAVADGMAAGQAYLEALAPGTTPERRAGIARDLRTYCGRDTLGMVRLARFFAEAR